jgi:hypothetical protein
LLHSGKALSRTAAAFPASSHQKAFKDQANIIE